MPMERITIAPGDMGGQPCIRDLQIKFWDVYRDLALRGMTADSVLQRYPQLERDDLSAVREYAVHLIQSRTHDEFTGRPILSREALKGGPITRVDAGMRRLPDGIPKGIASTIGRRSSAGSSSRRSASRPIQKRYGGMFLMLWKSCAIRNSRFRSTGKRFFAETQTTCTNTTSRCGAAPARRAEYSLTENALSPFQIEPTHASQFSKTSFD